MSIREIIFVVLIFTALPAACVFQEVQYARSIHPPDPHISLNAFLDLKLDKAIHEIKTFKNDDKSYLVVWGRFDPPYLALPSGPPIYVFGKDGKLVDWCADSGDNSAFLKKWDHFDDAKKISADSARKWVDAK